MSVQDPYDYILSWVGIDHKVYYFYISSIYVI